MSPASVYATQLFGYGSQSPELRFFLTQKYKEPMPFSKDGTQFINARPGTQVLNPLLQVN